MTLIILLVIPFSIVSKRQDTSQNPYCSTTLSTISIVPTMKGFTIDEVRRIAELNEYVELSLNETSHVLSFCNQSGSARINVYVALNGTKRAEVEDEKKGSF